MKPVFFLLLVGLPFGGFGQVVDTVMAGKEVDSLVQVNRKLVRERKFDQALEVIVRATQKAGEIFGAHSATYATCLFNHGRTFHAMRSYQQAESLYLEAKDIRAEVLTIEHSDYARSLQSLGALYVSTGYYDKAESLYLEAQRIFEKALGRNHPDYANLLTNLASLYFQQNNFKKAELFFLETKEIRAKTLGKEHPDYGLSINNLASLYSKEGEFSKAEQLYLEGISLQSKIIGKLSPDYATSLNNLAILYRNQGEYAKAEPLFLEAKEIRAKVLGKDDPMYAQSVNALGKLFLNKGDYIKAELLYIEAKNIRAKVLGEKHPEYAASLDNLAYLYYCKGEFVKAELLYLESKDLMVVNYGKENPQYAYSLLNIANLYYSKGEYLKSEQYNLEGIDIIIKTLGKDHPDYAKAVKNLALIYTDQGEYTKAEPLLIESKEIQTKMLGPEHPAHAETMFVLAQIYRATNRLPESASLFIGANNLNRNQIEKSRGYTSESQMLIYINTFAVFQDLYFSFCKDYSSPELNRTSFDNTLFFSGYLFENSRQLAHYIDGADSLTRDAYDRWKGCRRYLASEYTKPINERMNVIAVEDESEGYEKIITHNLPVFSEIRQVPQWQNVRKSLQPSESSVEFISFHYFNQQNKPTDSTLYAALLLLPTDTTPHFIPLFEERQLQALLNRPGLSEKLVLKDLYGNSPELRRLLWDPIEPLLRDVKTIYYSPSGLLHRLNPAALLDESNLTLSEGRQWVRVGSTRELVTGRLADRSFARAPEGNFDNSLTAMVYGGITYDMDSLAFAAANPIVVTDSTGNPQRKDGAFNTIITEQPNTKTSDTRGNPDGTWGALTATGQEADQVGAMLANAGFRTMKQKGFSASEEQFKQIGVGKPSPRILHMATHGFSYSDPKKNPSKSFGDSEPTYKMLDDPMLRSGLVLAGANYYWKNKRPLANREDGVLVAYEVRDLNLRNTELAVLSACQTGLGDVVGSEGVYGLQRAFRIAGAQFLIVSLWEVSDEQTQELMRLFYQNWLEKKESLRDAFNHAQQRLREKEPSPFMWAGFVLVE